MVPLPYPRLLCLVLCAAEQTHLVYLVFQLAARLQWSQSRGFEVQTAALAWVEGMAIEGSWRERHPSEQGRRRRQPSCYFASPILSFEFNMCLNRPGRLCTEGRDQGALTTSAWPGGFLVCRRNSEVCGGSKVEECSRMYNNCTRWTDFLLAELAVEIRGETRPAGNGDRLNGCVQYSFSTAHVNAIMRQYAA